MVTLERYKAAVQRLWTGKATVTVREGVLNEANGRTEPVERVLVEGAACRTARRTPRSWTSTASAPNPEARRARSAAAGSSRSVRRVFRVR